MNVVAQFSLDGYAVFGDLLQSGLEQVVIYTDEEAVIYGKLAPPANALQLDTPLQANGIAQTKRLYSSTLYPGGEY